MRIEVARTYRVIENEVQAMRLPTAVNEAEVQAVLDWIRDSGGGANKISNGGFESFETPRCVLELLIPGRLQEFAYAGDWIVRTHALGFRVWEDSAFRAVFADA
jgi:hypothetical protein